MDLFKLLLEEVISTGTGAAFTPGEGEQYATPFAFGKGKKKKRIPIIRKKLFEDKPYTSEAGEEEYKKLSTAVSEATSRVDRFTKSSKAAGPHLAEQLNEIGERLQDNLGELCNTANELTRKAEEAGDKSGYEKYSQLTDTCKGLQESLKTYSNS